MPSTPGGDDPSTVRRDSTRPPINSGQGSNRRVTAGTPARMTDEKSLESEGVELVRVDVQLANGGDGPVGGPRPAARQPHERCPGAARRGRPPRRPGGPPGAPAPP